MAVAYRSSTHTGNDAQGASCTVNVPSGATTGDIVVVVISRWENFTPKPAITPPVEFTHYATTFLSGTGLAEIDVYWKRLTSSDTGSYSFLWSGTFWNHGHCFCISGAATSGDPIESIDAWSGTAGSFGSTSVTVSNPPALIWSSYNDSNGTHTPPTGFTEVIDNDSGSAAYRVPGSSGTYSADNASVTSSSSAAAILIAVKEASSTMDVGSGAAIGTAYNPQAQVRPNAGSAVAGGSIGSANTNFPIVTGRSSGSQTTNATSHVITLPGSIQIDDTLLVVFSALGNPTCTDPSGLWTKLGQQTRGASITGAVFYKKATGGDSLTLTTSSATKSTHVAYALKGAGHPIAIPADGSGVDSDPPRLIL